MTAFAILLALLLLTMRIARTMQRVSAVTYMIVAFIAFLQVSALVISMYTMPPPEFSYWWLH